MSQSSVVSQRFVAIGRLFNSRRDLKALNTLFERYMRLSQFEVSHNTKTSHGKDGHYRKNFGDNFFNNSKHLLLLKWVLAAITQQVHVIIQSGSFGSVAFKAGHSIQLTKPASAQERIRTQGFQHKGPLLSANGCSARSPGSAFLGSFKARFGALADHIAFKLSEGGKVVKHIAAHSRCGVYAFREAFESNAPFLKLECQARDFRQVSAKPIVFPDNKSITPAQVLLCKLKDRTLERFAGVVLGENVLNRNAVLKHGLHLKVSVLLIRAYTGVSNMVQFRLMHVTPKSLQNPSKPGKLIKSNFGSCQGLLTAKGAIA